MSAAELQFGVRYRGLKDKLTIQAAVYNALNVRHYQSDSFHDFEPRNEYLPNQYEMWRVFSSATFAY
jgi:hypothetical protein